MDPYASGVLLRPTPKENNKRSATHKRSCTGSRKTCRRRELRRRAKLRKHKTNKNKANMHISISNTGSSGSIADKHDYIERLRQSLQDEINMLYNAGMNDEAKKKEELLATIRY